MHRTLLALAPLAISFIVPASSVNSSEAELPPFLRPYYRDAFNLAAKDMILARQDKKNDLSSYFYQRPDGATSLAFENFACERDRCQVVYDNAIRYFDKLATENAGRFLQVTQTEFTVEWKVDLIENTSVVVKLPNSVLFARYAARLDRLDAAFLPKFGTAVNRQRYDDTLGMGQVQMGLWNSQVHGFARGLLRSGKRDDALVVLKNLVASSPFDYEAHLEILENAPDSATARDSATVIYENAEQQQLTTKAARFLGYKEPDIAALPLLTKDDGGLHVVLVILPPCDLRLASDAALLYEKITGISVRLSRLAEDEPMDFGAPDRIPDQRPMQKAIIHKLGPTVDFKGWDLERYKAELLKTAQPDGALARYQMEDFVAKLQSLRSI